MRYARRVLRQAPLAAQVREEMLPGPGADSDADLARYAKRMVKTNYHPVGTARMGREGDPLAVLDSRLRVRGVQGLRVIDCAAIPAHRLGQHQRRRDDARRPGGELRLERDRRSRGLRGHMAEMPPSSFSSAPVMKRLSSEAR